jgi:ABC-type branched-subunit amino acid transport system substrate-binding protein
LHFSLHRSRRIAYATAVCIATLGTLLTLQATARASKVAPLTIVVTSPVNSSIASFPEYFYGVEAYIDAANAAGGWGGQQIKVVTCDNQYDPNIMANCARTAVTDQAVAMVGLGPVTAAFMGVLRNGHIPWFPTAAYLPVEYQAPNSFVINLGYTYENPAEVALAVKDKCPSVSILGRDVVAYQNQPVAAALELDGIPASIVTLPSTATDLSSYLAQATSHACLLILGIDDAEQASLAVAIAQSGHKFQNIISSPTLTTTAASQQPSVWNGAQIANTLSDYTGPGWSAYRANMTKYFHASEGTPEAQQSWAEARLIGSVASYLVAHKTAVTSTSLQAALNSNRSWSTGGALPTLNFHQSVGVPGATRLFTDFAAFQTVVNGKVAGAFGNKYISILPFLLNKKVALGTFGS